MPTLFGKKQRNAYLRLIFKPSLAFFKNKFPDMLPKTFFKEIHRFPPFSAKIT